MTHKLTNNVYSVGVDDSTLRVFDIIMKTENGTTYNSYLIKGSKKTALVEMVKDGFQEEHIKNLKEVIDVTTIDYIVVSHCEPDHSGSLESFLELCPNAQVIGSRAASNFLPNIVNHDLDVKVVGDGDTLDLGDVTLEFIMAPFLHWPDTMFTYVKEDKVLITSDMFGCHYYNENTIFDDADDVLPAQDYYFNVIMEPFSDYAVKTLERISNTEIDMICPSHGPILKDPKKIIDQYTEWTKDVTKVNDPKKVAIVYVSAYGYTRKLAQTFEKELTDMGYVVKSMDAQHVELGEIIAEINDSDALMVGSPTFNRDALPPIWDVMTSLSAIKQRNMPGCAFGSYGWSGEGANMLTARMKSIGLKIIDPLRVRLKPSEQDIADAVTFAKQFAELIK